MSSAKGTRCESPDRTLSARSGTGRKESARLVARRAWWGTRASEHDPNRRGGGPPDATRTKGSRSIAIELVDVAVQEYHVHEMALLLTPVISRFNRTLGRNPGSNGVFLLNRTAAYHVRGMHRGRRANPPKVAVRQGRRNDSCQLDRSWAARHIVRRFTAGNG